MDTEKLKELMAARDAEENGSLAWHKRNWSLGHAVIAALPTLLAELEAARKNEARYLWLRNEANPDADNSGIAVMEQDFNTWGKPYWKHYSAEDLDAAIDTAMEAQP